MAPGEFYQWYKNLSCDVTLPDGSPFSITGIESRNYLINYETNAVRISAARSLGRVRAKISDFNAHARRRGRDPIHITEQHFSYVGIGKAAPWEMEDVLACALASGLVDATQDAAQRFADECFGVDCTGFVSAYYRDLGVMQTRDAPNAGCPWFRGQARVRHNDILWDARFVQPGDVLVWMFENGVETRHPGHIALIESISDEGVVFTVESSGARPRDDPHRARRQWLEIRRENGQRYVALQEPHGIAKAIAIRPFNTWDSPPSATA